MEIPSGSFFKVKYGAKFEFSEGWGGRANKKSSVGCMDIFWNHMHNDVVRR